MGTTQDWAKHVRLANDTKVATDPHLRHCPRPDCDGAARLSASNLSLHTATTPRGLFGLRRAGAYVEATCGACGHGFCARCNGRPHPKDTCEAAADAGFMQWRRRKLVKPCPSCSYLVRATPGLLFVTFQPFRASTKAPPPYFSGGVHVLSHDDTTQTEKRGGCSHMSCAKCKAHWYTDGWMECCIFRNHRDYPPRSACPPGTDALTLSHNLLSYLGAGAAAG